MVDPLPHQPGIHPTHLHAQDEMQPAQRASWLRRMRANRSSSYSVRPLLLLKLLLPFRTSAAAAGGPSSSAIAATSGAAASAACFAPSAPMHASADVVALPDSSVPVQAAPILLSAAGTACRLAPPPASWREAACCGLAGESSGLPDSAERCRGATKKARMSFCTPGLPCPMAGLWTRCERSIDAPAAAPRTGGCSHQAM